jgi:hypothetical protein
MRDVFVGCLRIVLMISVFFPPLRQPELRVHLAKGL